VDPVIDDHQHAAAGCVLVRRHRTALKKLSGPSAERAVDGRMDAVSTTGFFDLTTSSGNRTFPSDGVGACVMTHHPRPASQRAH